MRLLTLYLRSRSVPAALVVATGCLVLMWVLWLASSKSRDAGPEMVVLTVLLMVAALTATLGGPDDALEATAAFAWLPRRAAHLLATGLVVMLLLLSTLPTAARFGPAGVVLRDTAGLLGLTALGAALIGPGRAWFAPLGWTLVAVVFPQTESVLGRVLTWQTQEPASRAAMVTAGVLAVGGLVAYAVAGPARKAPAEAGQQ